VKRFTEEEPRNKNQEIMKKLVILGAGTAGTIMANKLRKALPKKSWEITLVDREKKHFYQPGFLFIPFGTYTEKDVVKPKATFLPSDVTVIYTDIEKIEPTQNRVLLAKNKSLEYDLLVIATGAHLKPDETPGLNDKLYYKNIFDFYTLEGSLALYEYFKTWKGGKLVMAITELPFKCPVAPIEFVCLAEAFFEKKGMRKNVDLTFVTPLSGAFTKPVCSDVLTEVLEKKGIKIVTDFYIERIDNETKSLISYDGKEVSFDVLVIVPLNKGDDVIERSGLGDDLNFVPVNKQTLQHEIFSNIFAVGDAAAIPTSKAGSVAHFAADVLFENMMSFIHQKPLEAKFDGHSNCYIETGYGKATLVDFNYDTEPLSGTYPLAGIGPFKLLSITRINHWGKLMFRWIYWYILLKARPLPVSNHMSMVGKKRVEK
jgi:sulfide:quinone oxidoreductase